MYSLMVLGALAGSAMSQAITFSNTTFVAPVAVGAMWPISFDAGNGESVAIAFGNGSYSFQIVEGLSAPGMYSWSVAVPVDVVAGNYQLALLQDDADPVFSPTFTLTIPAGMSSQTTDAPTTSVPFPMVGAVALATATTTATTTVTAIYLTSPTGMMSNMTNGTWAMPMPTVTYIYWEESCGCHQTSSCAYSAMPTSMSTTTVTYSEKECGCTKTTEAPCAETAIPVPVVPTASPVPPPVSMTTTPMLMSTSMPATTPIASMPSATKASPVAYTGSAERVVAGSLGFVALVGAMVLA